MAGGAEVATFAGEGEEAFVAAVRAVEAEEAGGEVAAAEEVADGGEDFGAERAEGGTVELFVAGEQSNTFRPSLHRFADRPLLAQEAAEKFNPSRTSGRVRRAGRRRGS